MTLSIRPWFALLMLLFANSLWAGEAEKPGGDSRLIDAGRLFAQQDYARLQPLIDMLRAVPEPHLEVLFLSGMLHAQAGRFDQAAQEFRLMLARDPGLIRPRLELALSLQKSGDRQGAKYHYEQVLAAGLPAPVMDNIYRQLGDIREREPSVRMTLELSSDSNPKQATHNRVVYIGGQPYALNENSRAELIWGLAGTANVHWPLASDPSWFAHAYGELYEYPGRALDTQYGLATLGKRFEWGRHHISLEAGGHAYLRQGEKQYDGGAVSGTGFLRVSPQLALTGDVSLKTLTYPDLPYLSGSMTYLGGMAIYVPKSTQRWDFGVGVTHYQAREAAYTYTQPGITARFMHEWPGGWITGVKAQALLAGFDAPDPFFGEVRRDRECRLEFDVLNRKLKWWSFSPRLLVGYTWRDSNLELYDYKRAYGRIGLTREF
jgi:tetratricopeptide (TPR) repeat protein